MDFDLGDDIWDDIDDEKLVFASNFVSRELGKFISTNLFLSYIQIILQDIFDNKLLQYTMNRTTWNFCLIYLTDRFIILP